MPSKSDKEFGRLVLKRGFAARRQIEECLSIQRDLEKEGTPTTLDRVLLARSCLNPEQVGEIQTQQKRRIIFCTCQTRVNVFKYPPGKKLYCAKCREPLVVPTREELEGSLYRLLDAEVTELGPQDELPLPPPVLSPDIDGPATPPTGRDHPHDPVMIPTLTEKPSRTPTDRPSPPPPVKPPREVMANRRIEARLGEGGMGSVFRCRHEVLDRVEAFKIIKPVYANDPQYHAKFLREARIAANLRHPHITQVFEVVDEGGVLGYTMEFVDGESLAIRLTRDGPMEEPEVLRIVAELASALQCIHEAGIVHRDLKPGNILLDKKGRAVLTDLGLAKDVKTAGKSGFTSEGATLGTPAYMAPEQIESAKYADIRSDIYSLGALAYHALAGRPPFVGESVYDYLSAIINDDPIPPEKVRPGVSRKVSKLIMRMLKKDRTKRFQTPARVIEAVEKIHDRTGPGRG